MSDLRLLLHELHMQHPPAGVYTYNNCSTKGCGGRVRGAGRCGDCVTADIGEKVGHKLARKYRKALVALRHCENEMNDIIHAEPGQIGALEAPSARG